MEAALDSLHSCVYGLSSHDLRAH